MIYRCTSMIGNAKTSIDFDSVAERDAFVRGAKWASHVLYDQDCFAVSVVTTHELEDLEDPS